MKSARVEDAKWPQDPGVRTSMRRQTQTMVILFFFFFCSSISVGHAACQFPSELWGRDMTSNMAGQMFFAPDGSYVKFAEGLRHCAYQGVCDGTVDHNITFNCIQQTGARYFLRSSLTADGNVFTFNICMYLYKVTNNKWIYYQGPSINESTWREYLTSGTVFTESSVCNLPSPLPVSRYNLLLTTASLKTMSSSCPDDMLATFNLSGCATTTFDVCSTSTRQTVKVGSSSCYSTFKTDANGTMDCVHSLSDNGTTYAIMFTPKTNPVTFSCLAYRVDSGGSGKLYIVQKDEHCSDILPPSTSSTALSVKVNCPFPCSFPTALMGSWTNTRTGNSSVTFNTTAVQGFYSCKAPTCSQSVDTLSCYKTDNVNQYLFRSAVTTVNSSSVRIYMCVKLEQINNTKFLYYYLQNSTDAALNEYVTTYNPAQAVDMTQACTDVTAYSPHKGTRHHLLIKQGTISSSITQCPTDLRAQFKTLASSACAFSFKVCEPPGFSYVHATTTPTGCTRLPFLSSNGSAGCLYSITDGSTTYVTTYNTYDASTSPTATYAFACVVFSLSGTTLSLTQNPLQCLDTQSAVSITGGATGSAVFTYNRTADCPIDGQWGTWSSYASCSVTCGGGTQQRNRTCSNPPPANGGDDCVGNATETQDCNTYFCPINGNWGNWSSWTACDVTCGNGTQVRTRTCDNPAPAYNGTDCAGSSNETQVCNPNPCPVDGNWSQWGAWGTCSVTCDSGIQVRLRYCNDSAPLYNGSYCVGSDNETATCDAGSCPTTTTPATTTTTTSTTTTTPTTTSTAPTTTTTTTTTTTDSSQSSSNDKNSIIFIVIGVVVGLVLLVLLLGLLYCCLRKKKKKKMDGEKERLKSDEEEGVSDRERERRTDESNRSIDSGYQPSATPGRGYAGTPWSDVITERGEAEFDDLDPVVPPGQRSSTPKRGEGQCPGKEDVREEEHAGDADEESMEEYIDEEGNVKKRPKRKNRRRKKVKHTYIRSRELEDGTIVEEEVVSEYSVTGSSEGSNPEDEEGNHTTAVEEPKDLETIIAGAIVTREMDEKNKASVNARLAPWKRFRRKARERLRLRPGKRSTKVRGRGYYEGEQDEQRPKSRTPRTDPYRQQYQVKKHLEQNLKDDGFFDDPFDKENAETIFGFEHAHRQLSPTITDLTGDTDDERIATASDSSQSQDESLYDDSDEDGAVPVAWDDPDTKDPNGVQHEKSNDRAKRGNTSTRHVVIAPNASSSPVPSTDSDFNKDEDRNRQISDSSSGVADLSSPDHYASSPTGPRGKEDDPRRVSQAWEGFGQRPKLPAIGDDAEGSAATSRQAHRNKRHQDKDKRVKTALRRLLNERLFGHIEKRTRHDGKLDDVITGSAAWSDGNPVTSRHWARRVDRQHKNRVGFSGNDGAQLGPLRVGPGGRRQAFVPSDHERSADNDESDEEDGRQGRQPHGLPKPAQSLPPLRGVPGSHFPFPSPHYAKWDIYVSNSERTILKEGLSRDRSFLTTRQQARPAYMTPDGEIIVPPLPFMHNKKPLTLDEREDDVSYLDPHRPDTDSFDNSDATTVLAPGDAPPSLLSQASLSLTQSSRTSASNLDDRRLKRLLQELYKDKVFMDKLINNMDNDHMVFPGYVNADEVRLLSQLGRQYLLKRAEYWDRTGPLGPPRPFLGLSRAQTSLTSNATSRSMGYSEPAPGEGSLRPYTVQ